MERYDETDGMRSPEQLLLLLLLLLQPVPAVLYHYVYYFNGCTVWTNIRVYRAGAAVINLRRQSFDEDCVGDQ